jgi:hypothetical protein
MWVFVVVFWALPALAEMIVDTAWVRRYNGPGNNEDVAEAMAIDDSGNVYVTGRSWGSGTLPDYATIEYDSKGNLSWVQRYDGPANDFDRATAIALDSSGNVYVAGYSRGNGTDLDYATVKYGPNGNELWVRRYNGSGNAEDVALAIAVDGSNNIYVAGQSEGSATDWDYATIKYDSLGNELWVQRYNGPENSADKAAALALDGSGNVYVTGSTIQSGPGYYCDMATIKYAPDGTLLWEKRYNGPGNFSDWATAIAVDDSGNVYVTGDSYGDGTDLDFATIKYCPDGDTAWIRRYNGPGNETDWPYAMAVDGSSNIYVSGMSMGNGTHMDYATIKYYPNGDTAWVRRYNGPGNLLDRVYAIAVDDSSNAYVTGSSWSGWRVGTGNDYATIKYDASGNVLWVKRYNGPGNEWDEALAIAADNSGHVWVTGGSAGTGSYPGWLDYATVEYFQTLRGDVKRDGVIDLVDVMYLINYLYADGTAPQSLEVGNVNCDEVVDLGDVVFLINYLLKGGPAPDC